MGFLEGVWRLLGANDDDDYDLFDFHPTNVSPICSYSDDIDGLMPEDDAREVLIPPRTRRTAEWIYRYEDYRALREQVIKPSSSIFRKINQFYDAADRVVRVLFLLLFVAYIASIPPPSHGQSADRAEDPPEVLEIFFT